MSRAKSFSVAYLRRQLKMAPLDAEGELYEQIQDLGFEHAGMWIVNPYWSCCGRFEVDPLGEYGQEFLNSPIAAMLGFVLPKIIPAKADVLEPEQRARYDALLMQQVRSL